MDDYKDKKNKLLGLKKQIVSMPNNMLKINKTEGFVQLLGYLREIDVILPNEYDKYNIDNDFSIKYDRHVVKKTQNKINEVMKLAPYLLTKYSILIDEYKKNDFCSFEISLNNKINKDEMYIYFGEFLNLLGSDIVKLYNKMVSDNNIYLLPQFEFLGVSLNSITVDNPCIIIDDIEQYIDFYTTLIHELGHCYQFYLQRNHTHLESFNPFMETTSLFLEKMFIEFLKTKKIFNDYIKNYILEDNIYFLNDISISKCLCQHFINRDISNINAYDLSYSSNTSHEDLLLEVTRDCGYIMENKLNLSLTEFHYSLGNIIATYFVKKMKKDFYGTWKEYKDFICMVDNYPLKEIMDEYFDVNLMKEEIKTFIKSYHSR